METTLTAAEAAKRLQKSYVTVYRWLCSGRLKGQRRPEIVKGLRKPDWYIYESDLDAFIQKHRVSVS